jgi:hypothetical protein
MRLFTRGASRTKTLQEKLEKGGVQVGREVVAESINHGMSTVRSHDPTRISYRYPICILGGLP